MLPHTRWAAGLLGVGDRANPPTEDDLEAEVMDNIPADDPRHLALVLRKKNQILMLKRMLAEGGYPDLARMSSFRRVSEDHE